MKKNTLIAVLLALGLIASACGGDDADTAATTTTVAETTEVEEAVETTAPPTTEAEEEPAEEEDAEADEEAEEAEPAPSGEPVLLDLQFSPIDPGTYLVETTGVPFTITIDGEWWVQPNSDGWTVLTHPDSQGPDDRDIVFLRPSDLSDPSQPGADPDVQEGWPLDDLPGWLENITEGLITEPAVETQLGGRDALRFEAQVTDESMCGPEPFCIGFATNNLVNSLQFVPGSKSVVYWVDMGDETPLIVYIGSPADNDDWEATAEAILETIEFGEPGPNPIDPDGGPLWEAGITTDVPAGVQQFPALGGLQLELDEERFVVQEGDNFMVVFDGDVAGNVEIWVAYSDFDGTPIETTDELVAVLETIETTVTETDPSTHTLGEARSFETASTAAGPPGPDSLGIFTMDGQIPWFSPPAGRLWVFETDRGVVVVSAESFEGDRYLDQMTALAEDVVLPGAELIDFG